MVSSWPVRAIETVGGEGVVLSPQSMGGEDFGWFAERLPIALARLGTHGGGDPLDLHRGTFDVDERAIGVGVRLMARAALVDGMPAELIGLYEQIRARGRVAAAALNGSRCEACRMDLDRSALGAIWAAGVEDVVRCSECGAILIRS